MSDYRKNLNRIGWVLVLFGLIDISIETYCINQKIDYFSSFNIFAVFAGIFLIKHNLKVVNIVTKFSIFYLGGIVGVIILSPWLIFKNSINIRSELSVFPNNLFDLIYMTFVFILIWIYRSLRDESIVEAIRKADIKLGFWGKTPFNFFYLGLIVSIVAALLQIFQK